MSISERGRLLVAAAVLAGTTAGWVAMLGRLAPRHFIPQQRMAAAVAAGGHCDVFFGDSRMDAAFDPAALRRGYRASGSDRCLVDLAIGATDVSGAYLTVRQYLSAQLVPATVVVGMAGDSLLDPPPLRPENAVGNNAIHLIWSRAADVGREVPGLAGVDIAAWDAAFRFSLARATPLGRYQSLLWSRVQKLDQRLAGTGGAANRFGASGDMAQLEARFRSGAAERLEAALGTRGPLFGRWFDELLALSAKAGAAVTIVELPMPASYRRAVTDLPEAVRYRKLLADQLRARGADYLDFSDWAAADDSVFMDGLHLGPKGAAEFSAVLGAALGAAHGDAPAEEKKPATPSTTR